LDAGYAYTPDEGRTYPFRGRNMTIPTLSEFLDQFADANINIEIKRNNVSETKVLMQLLEKRAASDATLRDRLVFTSRYERSISAPNRTANELEFGLQNDCIANTLLVIVRNTCSWCDPLNHIRAEHSEWATAACEAELPLFLLLCFLRLGPVLSWVHRVVLPLPIVPHAHVLQIPTVSGVANLMTPTIIDAIHSFGIKVCATVSTCSERQ
jgi:hypothetical protein